jgi:hypothetical protein
MLGALEVMITEDDQKRIDAVVKPRTVVQPD